MSKRKVKEDQLIELQYESKFDGFLVDLRIGPAEVLNRVMFGGNPVFTYKTGATVSADTMEAETFGCLVWVEKLDGSPESMATFFHELVHASAVRFRKSGVLKRAPRRKDMKCGLTSFDELMANSVGELGTAFLEMLAGNQ